MDGRCWCGFFHLHRRRLIHGTYTINSLSHVFGRQRYRREAATMYGWRHYLGEGCITIIHHYPASVRQVFTVELDITFYLLETDVVPSEIWDLKRCGAVREGNGKDF